MAVEETEQEDPRPEALDVMAGYGVDREHAQELADHVRDRVREQTGSDNMQVQWAIEEAVMGAFGFETDE
jgi:hypothetical protein